MTMRFVWAFAMISAVLALLEAVKAASPVPPSPNVMALAPADEYFGRERISVIRMHHQVFALKDDLHQRRQRPDAIQHGADSISDAYFDWAGRFPRDRWLPRIGWELATLYEELPGFAAQDRALTLLAFIEQHYSDTEIGRATVQDLMRGVGLRPWPRWAGKRPVQHLVLAGRIRLDDSSDAKTVLQAARDLETLLQTRRVSAADAFGAASRLESVFSDLPSHDGTGGIERRCAWELATLYELLPGEVSRDRAIRMLAVVLDRYGNTQYGLWSLHDLQRGVGVRNSDPLAPVSAIRSRKAQAR